MNTCPTFTQLIFIAIRIGHYRTAFKAARAGFWHWFRWTFDRKRMHRKTIETAIALARRQR